MKRIVCALTVAVLPLSAFAADALNGTVWKTVDDKTKQPKALVKFTENSDGSLSGTIQKVIDPQAKTKTVCYICEGRYKNKSLVGAKIVTGLKKVSDGQYANGSIIDPESGKTYKFKANLSKDGKVLSGRGFIGVSALGRDQTWYRVN